MRAGGKQDAFILVSSGLFDPEHEGDMVPRNAAIVDCLVLSVDVFCEPADYSQL
jgi:hypothetical protein